MAKQNRPVPKQNNSAPLIGDIENAPLYITAKTFIGAVIVLGTFAVFLTFQMYQAKSATDEVNKKLSDYTTEDRVRNLILTHEQEFHANIRQSKNDNK